MPRCSAFTPFGLMSFSRRTPAQDIYRAMVAGQSAAFDMTKGTPAEAEAYATSMALARARASIVSARNQHDPGKAYEMLPTTERDFGVVPGETDTIAQRQRVVAARNLISRGPRAESIENALRTLLGDVYVGYRVTSNTEKTVVPADPTNGPGVFARDSIPSKVFCLTSTASMPGVEVPFTYARLGDDDGVRLVAGDIACVEPEHSTQTEKVTILSVSELTATAVFTKGHGVGASVIAGPVPIWRSTKRHVFVVVTSLAAIDPETRRKVHDLMRRISRAVTTWSIIQASSSTTIGPFTLELSPLDTVPLETSSLL